MIRAVYLIKNTGDSLFIRYYDSRSTDEVGIGHVPHHVRACIMLMSSRSSSTARPYKMKQESTVWVYYFHESFTTVLEASSDESIEHLNKKVISLGKAVRRVYGPLISSWLGPMNSIEGLAELIDTFVLLEITPRYRSSKFLERAVTKILERHPIAYVGVLDSIGNLLQGNVPENHLKMIRQELGQVGLTTSVDIVPTTIEIDGYAVQMLRVQSLSLVAASYRDGDRLDAVRAIDELAEMVTKAATARST